jgi:hypothetical protein
MPPKKQKAGQFLKSVKPPAKKDPIQEEKKFDVKVLLIKAEASGTLY